MYKIYADNMLFYDDVTPSQDFKVLDPKIKLADNSAGSLTFKLPINNIIYDRIARMTSLITVYCDDKEIWQGRVITEKEDFWKQRTITCEGELAFFNDTIQPPSEFHGTIEAFLSQLIDQHNYQVTGDKINKFFKLGKVTVEDPNDYIYRYTNYETTLECLLNKLVDRLGGHLIIRKENGQRYLDYLEDYPNTNQQVIEFGINLMDFTKTFDLSNLTTVLVPRGNRLEESPIEALDAYLTVASVNDGSIYVKNAQAVETYGNIVSVVDWDNVSDPNTLLKYAELYLASGQFDKMILEVTAVDLHLLNVDTERIKLLDNIRCKSTPHGMDRYFPVTSIEIPLDKPEETKFILNNDFKNSLTGSTTRSSSDLANRIAELPSKQIILNEARKNSKEILNTTSHGFITLEQDDEGRYYEQDILDTVSKDTATKAWIWNSGGLAYVTGNGQRCFDDDGKILDTATIKAAITMDGSIVADRISTGTMLADRILGGTLTLGGYEDVYGVLNIKSSNGRNVGKWTKDGIVVNDESNAKKAMLNDGRLTFEYNDSSGFIEFDEFNQFQMHLNADTNLTMDSDSVALSSYGAQLFLDEQNSSFSTRGDFEFRLGGNMYINGSKCSSGSINYISEIHDNGDGSIGWTTNSIYVDDGFITSL